MNGIETPERMPLDQIAGQKEDIILKIHSNVGIPITFELPTGKSIPTTGKGAFPELAGQAGKDFGISDLGCCDGAFVFHKGFHPARSFFGDEPFNEGACV